MNIATRWLLCTTAVSMIGRGVTATIAALFATQVVGLGLREVGLALTAVAGIAVCLSTWLGHLGDRWGVRGVYAGLQVVEAAGVGSLAWVRDIRMFFVAVLLIAVADVGLRSAQGTVIQGIVAADQRVRTRAVVRVVSNIGIAAGGAAGGVVLALDRADGYTFALRATGLLLLLAAGLSMLLPAVPQTVREPGTRRWEVLRDRPFLQFMALNGILNIHNPMLKTAIPIWVAVGTDAPKWIVSVVFGVNVVSVVLLQIRLSRGTDTLRGATRAGRRSGVALAIACILLALSDVTSQALTIGVLLAAALVHVLGEILESASGWGVSFAVAAPGLTGQYQGVHAMGRGVGDLVGPVLLTSVAVSAGWSGWLLVALIFAIAGFLVPRSVGSVVATPATAP
ncbi:MAG TPA: MFS transporter [Kribbella sp.]|nr:MFS transporter [Kribbella sp.]